MRRVKRRGDTSRKNRTLVLGAVMEHSGGLGRNEISRLVGKKPDTVHKSLQRLLTDGFLIRQDNGKGRRSPYLVNPDLSYDEFEEKCWKAGLFRPEHGHLLAESIDRYAERRGRQTRKRGVTIGKALDQAEKVANFLIGQKVSRKMGPAPTPRSFSQEKILKSLSTRVNPRLLMLLGDWFIAILRKGPKTVQELRLEAPLGGKPLRSYLVLATLDRLRRQAIVYSDNGIWHLLNKRSEFYQDPDL